MNRNDFILPVSIVKIKEKKLLTEQKLIRMIETNTLKDILKTLNDTEYAFAMAGVTSDEMYEEILFNETKRVFEFVRELAKDEQGIVDLIALKYEYQNLKLRLKNDYSNSNLEKHILDTGIKRQNLEKNLLLASKEKDLQKASILLDKMYLEDIDKLSKELSEDIFKEYSKIVIDKYNFITFLRLKKQNKNIDFIENIFAKGGSIAKEELIKIFENDTYLPLFKKNTIAKYWDKFEKDRNISDIEKMFDNMVIDLALKYRNVTIGPEPIFTYIIAKEYEMKALRLIMSGKLNNIDPEVIKERLRGVYV
ncbi:V-type ATPase subunit [Streptobacillus felis]|uniref:V-type ATPase subunit n=1 Tax=Streptobacillus felis TaxID=1384509 RepID=A0A7Z0PG09_9FUSO|nr:V-type ATPase subunit [Streptobacillus felis]NYV28379.1 V-type ATPase subunit [Streptobacillus felis]